ncbi:hypothetical protein EGR_05044 [Echinococcus granulosus]|uniref:Uncharacterized protein n=1 Tax=Echinococcus granulosus TaxID=6210 RepID=W6UGE8_ECHGR|nr:hypothetical protein EGR_05044 [Echinococcus granulosus]EUB60046.1 hypothetical protein EGR_05044 [Echinococcus granulosus]
MALPQYIHHGFLVKLCPQKQNLMDGFDQTRMPIRNVMKHLKTCCTSWCSSRYSCGAFLIIPIERCLPVHTVETKLTVLFFFIPWATTYRPPRLVIRFIQYLEITRLDFCGLSSGNL